MPETVPYGRRQRDLLLILAREFASKLATPTLVADASGNVVFYNESAEEVLGRTFAEAGELPARSWSDLFHVAALDGSPLPLEEMPAGISLAERRPAHGQIVITSLDGAQRALSVTAFPLLASPTELVGIVTVFWEPPEAEGAGS